MRTVERGSHLVAAPLTKVVVQTRGRGRAAATRPQLFGDDAFISGDALRLRAVLVQSEGVHQ